MVSVRVLEKDEYYLKAIIEGVTPPLVNALRRAIISDVPVLAIDEVIILDNTSVLYDEVLAHRLAMIPIKTDLNKFPKIEECEEELVDPILCQVKFELNVEAKDFMIVYSKDLKSEDPDIRPVFEDIPIVKLAPGQRVVLEAYARLGRGRKHAKWQPGIAAYYYYPKVEIVGKAIEGCKACLEFCDGLEIRDDGTIVIRDPLKCTFNQWKACEQICPSIKVEWDENKYVFWIESFGNMSVDDMLKEAFRQLKLKFEEFIREIEIEASRALEASSSHG